MPILQGNAKSVADGGFYPTEIAQSLRFNDNDSAYLSRTPTSAGNRKTWTFSAWVKRGNLGIQNTIFAAGVAGTNLHQALYFGSGDKLEITNYGVGTTVYDPVFRDPSAWYHIVLAADTTQAAALDRHKLYVNGVQITGYTGTAGVFGLNLDTSFNTTTQPMTMGRDEASDSYYLDGYMAECHFTDGTAYTADDFGEFKSGVWVAKTPSVTYGTNGFYLPFDGIYNLAYDSTGLNGGTVYGATVTNDATRGDVGSFNGSSDYIQTGVGIPTNQTNYSIFGWGKIDTDGYRSIVSGQYYAGSTNAKGIDLSLSYSDLTPYVRLRNGTAHYFIQSSTTISTGTWYHVGFVKEGSTVTLYLNGTQVGQNTSVTGLDDYFKNLVIGGYTDDSPAIPYYYDGLISDIYIYNDALTSIEVTALYNESGIPTENLIAHYPLDQTSQGFVDASSNSNNWTPNNLAYSDVMLDSPTNNFATFNPLNVDNVITGASSESSLSEGGLKATCTNTSTGSEAKGTIAVSSGKWYFEAVSDTTGNNTDGVGIYSLEDGVEAIYRDSGDFRFNGSESAYGASWQTSGDIIGVAFDLDNTTISFYKNGVSQGNAKTDLPAKTYYPFVYNRLTGSITANFGQDSSFAGTKTPQGNTDDNGIGDFYYAPPTGYLALCTANLPEPVISPLNGVSPTDYMNTLLYTGDGTNNSAKTGVGFAPDMVWLKSRSTADGHVISDTVRGTPKGLYPFGTYAENTNDYILSIDSDGFTTGTSGNTNNYNGWPYVAWNWKAGGTAVSNTNGTITSSVSANTESGFSIVSWTGTGANGTIGHGLNQAPEMAIIKNRTDAVDWIVGNSYLTSWNNYFLYLNQTAAQVFDTNSVWNATAPTDTTISLGFFNGANGASDNMIAYCFHSVEGFSKIGSYVGNGSTDGTFVYCGFRPSMVICKRTDSSTYANWVMKDNLRANDYNPATGNLYSNLSYAEDTTSTVDIDLLSNGFKIRGNYAGINASGGTYIYIAFAENPFKYSNAR